MKKKVCVFTIHAAKDLRILNRQCHSLQRNGWDVTLIAIANKRVDDDAIVGEYNDDGIKVIGVERWTSLWGRIKTLFKITKLASKENTDIYHFHDPDLLIPALLLKLKKRKPFIYDIHEHYDIIFSQMVPDIWLLRQIVGGMVWFIELFLGMFFRNISLVYSKHIKKYQRLGCRTVHTPNYASMEDFVPKPVSEEEWQERQKRIIFIGSLAPARGSLVLPDVAKIVKQKYPDVEFLVIKRFHNAVQEQSMLDKLKSPEYKDVITFLPNVSGKELPNVVRKAGIALSVDQPTHIGLTSQPTKTFEYMSQALPIVASDLPNTREYVEGTGCGILVKPDDPDAYAKAVIKLLEDSELARKMGDKGQEAFKEKFNWSIVEKRLINFYHDITKKW